MHPHFHLAEQRLSNFGTNMLSDNLLFGCILCIFVNENHRQNRRIVAGEAVSATSDAFVDAWWSCAGAALYGACGALTLIGWRDVPDCPRRTHARATAMCAIAATVLLVADALLALCAVDKDDLSSRSRAK
jgi:hypothetical protein